MNCQSKCRSYQLCWAVIDAGRSVGASDYSWGCLSQPAALVIVLEVRAVVNLTVMALASALPDECIRRGLEERAVSIPVLPSVIRPISEVSVIHWCLLSSNRSVMMELIDPATSVACSGDCNSVSTRFVRQTCTIQISQCTTSHRLRHCTCELLCSQPIASVGLPACHVALVSAAAVLGMESSKAHGHIAPARALLLVHVRHDVDKHGSRLYPPPTSDTVCLLSSLPELTNRRL